MIQRSVSGWSCGGRVSAWWSCTSWGSPGLLLPRPNPPRVSPGFFLILSPAQALVRSALHTPSPGRAIFLVLTEGLYLLLAFAWREGEGRVGASLQATFMLLQSMLRVHLPGLAVQEASLLSTLVPELTVRRLRTIHFLYISDIPGCFSSCRNISCRNYSVYPIIYVSLESRSLLLSQCRELTTFTLFLRCACAIGPYVGLILGQFLRNLSDCVWPQFSSWPL